MFPSEPLAVGVIASIVVTSFYSVLGFRHSSFREHHLFSVREILAKKQIHRVFTSALLHADWNHLLLNMVSLYLFGSGIELLLGLRGFLLIYLAAVVGGSALSLWIHRNHEYRAYGASGGVCGVIFGSIFLLPGGSVVIFPIPVPIPAWLYAILFFVGSVLALKRNADNIGHDAHLGGAIIGLWTTALLEPGILRLQPKLFVVISVLAVVLFAYLVKNPLFLPLSSFLTKASRSKAPPAMQKPTRSPTAELDLILDKISRSGIDSLTPDEVAKLKSASDRFQRQSDAKPKNHSDE